MNLQHPNLMALSTSTIQNLSLAMTPDVIDDIFLDERFIELMMELISEFVTKNLQTEDCDLVAELSIGIMENILMRAQKTT